MTAELTCLTTARRRSQARTERAKVPLVVQAEQDSVRLIIGNGEDGVELAFSPAVWAVIVSEILVACEAAKGRTR